MQYFMYEISEKIHEPSETTIFRLKPVAENKNFPFVSGQYCFLKNPASQTPQEEHPFSIASSPSSTQYLEFCIKESGDWTKEFAKSRVGNPVLVSKPQGSLSLNPLWKQIVFLLGGIGISPVVSMLRFLEHVNTKARITLLYGNRTPETIMYRDELERLQKTLSRLKLVHIFSEIPESHPWIGYRGFITKGIVEKEVDLSDEPVFVIIGPPIFIEKMRQLLRELSVPQSKIKTENLTKLGS